MNIITIVGLCLVATIICKLLERYHKEYAILITIGTVGITLILVISFISPILDKIEDLFNASGVPNEYLEIIFKAIGICYITQLGCDCCKDANENAIASELELAGKLALLIIALPLFSALTDIVKELISF